MRSSKYSIEVTKRNIAIENAAERLWEKLEFWTNDISLDDYDPEKDKFNGTWDLVASKNDLLDFLLDEVEEEFLVKLNSLHRDWAMYMFLYHNITVYNNEFEKTLEARE